MIRQYLSDNELILAQELFETGLINASKAFSALAKQQIELQMGDLAVFDSSYSNPVTINKQGELTLITTEIIGELHGMSYLIFDDQETKEILSSCLPANLPDNEKDKIKDALLRELDNILSAAVITELSNRLNLKIFGDVPVLSYTSKEKLEKEFEEEFNSKTEQKEAFGFSIYSRFLFENHHSLNPNFIWRFSEKFLTIIREEAEKTANIKD